MKKLCIVLCALLNLFCTYRSFAQDSVITNLAKANVSSFLPEGNSFSGLGWTKIMEKVNGSNNVLIGEDHFTNEIPYFTSALASQVKFDNFFCEIDPFTAGILQQKIKNLSEVELQKYVSKYGNTFSFYALTPEFALLKQLTKSNTQIHGTDQIMVVGDRVICNELQKITKNKKAKEIYTTIENNSKVYFDNFLKDRSKPLYLFTTDFEKNIEELSLLQLSPKEGQIIAALKQSVKIYKSRNHHLRIQLMKNQLMEEYSDWAGKRNLFKYGANHLAKGESLMEVYDIGNLVNNIDDSNYKNSSHIMILGMSGTQASPFQGDPEEKVNENSSILKTLKPITKAIDGNQWYCFDMLPLRKALNEGKISISDIQLSRIIKGYDLLVVIPKVTASKIAL
ncbi:hypothetical protein [Pedobacter nototheniae]|uniref:hypothetical protein n=1 Tax=Pedobacter nototheniae TaxID=2488994 RepID=UPI002931CF2B|nr:hypothetical protein [Pedobacter nototheniae]